MARRFAIFLTGLLFLGAGCRTPVSGSAPGTLEEGMVTATIERGTYDYGENIQVSIANGLRTPIQLNTCNGRIGAELEQQMDSTWVGRQSTTMCLDFQPGSAPHVLQSGERVSVDMPLTRRTLRPGNYRVKTLYQYRGESDPHSVYSNTFQLASGAPQEQKPIVDLNKERYHPGETITLTIRNTTDQALMLDACPRGIAVMLWKELEVGRNRRAFEEFHHQERCRGAIEGDPAATMNPRSMRSAQFSIDEPGTYYVELPYHPYPQVYEHVRSGKFVVR